MLWSRRTRLRLYQSLVIDGVKTALRMIPYGLYVLTAKGSDGKVAAAPVCLRWLEEHVQR